MGGVREERRRAEARKGPGGGPKGWDARRGRKCSRSLARRRSLSCPARPHRPPLFRVSSVSLFFHFHRNSFGVVCRIVCFTIIPVVASTFVLAWIPVRTPLAPTRIAAFRELVFVRERCPSIVIPRL